MLGAMQVIDDRHPIIDRMRSRKTASLSTHTTQVDSRFDGLLQRRRRNFILHSIHRRIDIFA